MDSDLIEGIHYSIMFYGGRLLNHLSARDPEVEEFISLRRLNRHIAILIDSDKANAHSRINETKRRVRQEFDDPNYPGHAWITDGRTIENYAPLNMLASALAEIQPSVTLTYQGDKWANPLAVTPDRRVDKIKIAQAVCSRWSLDQLDHRDLQKQVRRIVQFIRIANGRTSV